MKRLLTQACLMAVVLFSLLRVEAQDDQYIHIYRLIQEGDNLKSSAQPAPALEKYLEAEKQLLHFQKFYPEWNSNVVRYRLGYLANTITDISAKNPNLTRSSKAIATDAAGSSITPAMGSGELGNQLGVLQSQVRQLEADKGLLESKLREALRVQPATTDPRAIIRAEQEIKMLSKENALLKVGLSERPAKAVPEVDARAVDQMRKQLINANRKAAEQSNRAAAFASEKAALEKKLASLIPPNWNATNMEATQKALEETNRGLAEQTGLAAQLALEKIALQMRVKTLMTENEVTAALRAENEVLKRQVAEFKAALTNVSQNAMLTDARAQLAALQSEKAALESRLKQANSAISTNNVAAAMSSSVDAERVKQLERERTDLQKRLEATQKELYGRSGKGASGHVDQLSGQVEVLRTRLAVMEMQQIAYTPEELELFKKPDPQIADPKDGKKSARDLSSGSMVLVREAQKDFVARRFDQAEAKYQQVLKQNDKNVYALANLAAIQLEINHLDDAERNINHALALAPEDPYSLSLLGFLRFRQNQFDAALDVLARAAKLDPQNAEIQNYIGLTLSQKGMRKAAESALRKAIALDPKYPSAHYNLAVICITQKPPDPAMARFHYKKALAAGMSANPEMDKMISQSDGTEAVP